MICQLIKELKQNNLEKDPVKQVGSRFPLKLKNQDERGSTDVGDIEKDVHPLSTKGRLAKRDTSHPRFNHLPYCGVSTSQKFCEVSKDRGGLHHRLLLLLSSSSFFSFTSSSSFLSSNTQQVPRPMSFRVYISRSARGESARKIVKGPPLIIGLYSVSRFLHPLSPTPPPHLSFLFVVARRIAFGCLPTEIVFKIASRAKDDEVQRTRFERKEAFACVPVSILFLFLLFPLYFLLYLLSLYAFIFFYLLPRFI